MRPQDIVILLKLISFRDKPWQYRDLSFQLHIPISEISVSFKRSEIAGLYNSDLRSVHRNSFLEFIIFGLKYVFPTRPGALVTGMPTAHSHPFYKKLFSADIQYVWPDEEGSTRGLSIEPLHLNVPKAAKNDDILYKLLASIDVLRVGRVREVQKAIEELKTAII